MFTPNLLTKFTISQLLESNVHVGHSPKSLNPSMFQYIYGVRNNYSVFDLEKTVFLLKRALKFVESLTSSRGKMLFTTLTSSRSLQRLTYWISKSTYQYSYSRSRWEGGILSNWKEILEKRSSIYREFFKKNNKCLTKVERRNFDKVIFFINSMSISLNPFSLKKLYLKSTKNSRTKSKFKYKFRKKIVRSSLPDAVFLINPNLISYPILESFNVGIPLIGLVDSNNMYSSFYSYPIPSNDDSTSSIRLFLYLVGAAALKGVQSSRRSFWNFVNK